MKEEIGLDIDITQLNEHQPFFTYLWHNRDFIERGNYHTICQYYTYEVSDIPAIQCLDETADYKFITAEECATMINNGDIPFKDSVAALATFFDLELETTEE